MSKINISAAYVLEHPVDKTRIEEFNISWAKAREYYSDKFYPDVAPYVHHVIGINSERLPRIPDWRGNNGRNRKGHTACYWGHVQMWRQALAENDRDFNDGAVVFFEDDCRLDENFWEVARQAYSELPDDWDIIYFGGQHCIHGRPRPTIYSDHLFKLGNVNRLHAYSFKISSLPDLILWFEEHHEWGHRFNYPRTGLSEAEVDYAIGSLTEDGTLHGYALRHWACSQGASFSWTQGKQEVDRRWEL